MNTKILTKLMLTHTSGNHLFPYMSKNNKTKNAAYNLFKKGNIKEGCIETTDENKVIDLVVNHNYSVRSRSLNAVSRSGIYRLNQRSITKYKIQSV
jgi:hypothetical protein